MIRRDALGRRRAPSQERGLRPLHPRLPEGLVSRSVRVAMPPDAWERLDEHVERSPHETAPRAIGALVAEALDERRPAVDVSVVTDWQEFQIRKERALLDRVADIAS